MMPDLFGNVPTSDLNLRGWCVYVLRSEPRTTLFGETDKRSEWYTGITNDISARIYAHNYGLCKTTKGRVWTLSGVYFAGSKTRAAWLEKWLKTGDTKRKREQFLACVPSEPPPIVDSALYQLAALDHFDKWLSTQLNRSTGGR